MCIEKRHLFIYNFVYNLFLLYKYSHHIVTFSAGFRLLPDNQLEKEREDGTSDLGKQVTLTYLQCMINVEVEFAFVSE